MLIRIIRGFYKSLIDYIIIAIGVYSVIYTLGILLYIFGIDIMGIKLYCIGQMHGLSFKLCTLRDEVWFRLVMFLISGIYQYLLFRILSKYFKFSWKRETRQ